MTRRTDFSATMPLAGMVALSLILSGCSAFSKEKGAELNIIYNQAAHYHQPDRNPVIVIPGILGSKLVDDQSGQVVWGAFDATSADPSDPAEARMIALPVAETEDLASLTDDVRPNGVLDKVHVSFLGIPIDIRAYAGILATLGAGGYRDEALAFGGVDYGDDHFTCFQFDYDWRRDNVENARRLKAFIAEKRLEIQANYKERYGIEDADVKFDIVAHSMGGLISRYFLRYGDADLPADGSLPALTWAGSQDIDRLVLVGTPNMGSINAFTQLVEGYHVGPFLPYYQASLLGTFPSIYELLPRPRHGAITWDDGTIVDLYDPALWESQGWALASTSKRDLKFLKGLLPTITDDQTRRSVARSLQRRILARSQQFHEALDTPASPPLGTEIFLVAGDAEPTPSRLEVNRATGQLTLIEEASGDGTVLRTSALADERVSGEWRPSLVSPIDWETVMFLPSNHIGLTQNPSFSDNVLYWLLEEPRD